MSYNLLTCPWLFSSEMSFSIPSFSMKVLKDLPPGRALFGFVFLVVNLHILFTKRYMKSSVLYTKIKFQDLAAKMWSYSVQVLYGLRQCPGCAVKHGKAQTLLNR